MVSKKDIDGMNLKALNALIQQATARVSEIRDAEIQEARAKVQEMAADLGITIFELVGISRPMPGHDRKPKGDGTRTPAKAKYQLPDGREWSGKGKLPLALRDALKGAEGYSEEDASFDSKEARTAALEKFLIK